MNILILDDEKSSREVISKLISDGVKSVSQIFLADDFETAQKLLLREKINVLLIDVSMPEGTGFDFLDQLDYSRYSVVFITAYKEYALEAVKYRAFDYLLKPLKLSDLVKVFERIENAGSENASTNLSALSIEEHKIDITTDSGHVIEHIDNILYIESKGHNSTIFLSTGQKLESNKSIGYFEKLLTDLPFFRIHNIYLVNLQKIAGYNVGDLDVTLMTGETLPLAKRKKSLFVKHLKEIIIS